VAPPQAAPVTMRPVAPSGGDSVVFSQDLHCHSWSINVMMLCLLATHNFAKVCQQNLQA